MCCLEIYRVIFTYSATQKFIVVLEEGKREKIKSRSIFIKLTQLKHFMFSRFTSIFIKRMENLPLALENSLAEQFLSDYLAYSIFSL